MGTLKVGEVESQMSVTSSNRSSTATVSTKSSVESRETDDETRFRWRNQSQHILFFLGFTMTCRTALLFTHEDNEIGDMERPNFLQMCVMLITFAGPLLFLEMFLGQFTQRGIIFLGVKLPIACGFGYCVIIGTFLKAASNLYYSSLLLYYTLVSVVNYPTSPWAKCHKHWQDPHHRTCFSLDDIKACRGCSKSDQPACFNKSTHVFSSIIFRNTAVGMTETVESLQPQGRQSIHLLAVALLIYLLSARKIKNVDWVVRYGLLFCLIATILSFLIFIFYSKRFKTLLDFFSPVNPSTLSYKAWLGAFERSFQGLRLAEGGQILFGSYMSPTTNSTFRVCVLIVCFMAVQTFITFFTILIENYLACLVNVEKSNMLGFENKNDMMFCLIPLVFSTIPASQLWSSLYFLSLFMTTLISIVLQVIIIEESLSEEFGKSAYYLYSRFAVVALMFFFGLVFTSESGYHVLKMTMYQQKFYTLIVVTIIYISTFIYTIQRLSDDIQFLLLTPPSMFLKACWLMAPVFSTLCLYYHFTSRPTDNEMSIFLYIMLTLIISPFVIGFIVVLVLYVNARNLTGLLRASERWGPPDRETRTMRQLFNPRFEVRYRQRIEACKHNCLLNSIGLRRALDRELALVSKILIEIEENDEERVSQKLTLVELHKHRDLMMSFLSARRNIQRTPRMYKPPD